jgi:hypothetical protein
MVSDRHVLTAAHCRKKGFVSNCFHSFFCEGFYDSLVKERESISIYLFVIGAHYSTDEHVYSGLEFLKMGFKRMKLFRFSCSFKCFNDYYS